MKPTILSKHKFNIRTFDIETSDATFAHASKGYDLNEFKAASLSGKDFQSHPYFKVHARSRLLQLYGPRTKGSGWIAPGNASYRTLSGGETSYNTSDFSAPMAQMAHDFGTQGEVEAVQSFYSNLERSMKTSDKPVALSGWNMGYDVSGLEAATYRHPELSSSRGFFAKHSLGKSPKLHLIDSSENFFSAAWKYGEHNPAFKDRYFSTASRAEDLRKIRGWGVENIADAMGGGSSVVPGFKAHLAHWDTKLTEVVAQRFADLHQNLEDGKGFEEAIHAAGIAQKGQTAEDFFSTVYSAARQKIPAAQVAAEVLSGAEVVRKAEHMSGRKIGAIVAITAGAIVAGELAFSTRRSRQTQITGLAETGLAADRRHKTTDFGSGYRGLGSQENDEHHSISMRTAIILSTGGALAVAHRQALKHNQNYAPKLFDFFKAVEDRSPHGQLRTFRFAEALSAHLPDKIHYGTQQLQKNGRLTPLGETIRRMSEGQIDVFHVDGIHFERDVTSPGYLNFVGNSDVKIRFAKGNEHGSVMAGAAERYHADLTQGHGKRRGLKGDSFGKEVRNTDESWWSFHRKKQNPGRAKLNTYLIDTEKFETKFVPVFSRVGTEAGGITGAFNKVKSAARNLDVIGFESAERFQHMMATMGLGLRQGSYNKLMHLPFAGEGGLVNEMLLRRVLPAVVAYKALQFIDYKLGHKPSDFLASLPLKARVLHAEVTDRTPGARKVTDWYKNVTPGGQFGPLALPIGAAFIGGASSYIHRAFGAPEHVLPVLRDMAFAKHFPGWLHNMVAEVPRAAVIGAVIGGTLALPFMPGMLGDRKTTNERRRIYSGEELIPVRQGRWWEMGPTPWEGGRITYFQKHWFASRKAHAEDVSLYGSEKAKWANSPWLHPIKYLRDPYFLEKRNYETRPYPVTSPAFSNVPLVGPILAATIGRFIKPIVQMHTDEWKPGDDYALFGQRLEPKGQKVESKYELQVREHLARNGYAVETQQKIKNYRADFSAIGEEGKKVVIEADGERFHMPWRKKKDDKRQAEIEKEGWDVVRVRSADFFSNPNKAMAPIYQHLQAAGIKRIPTNGRDFKSGLAGFAAPTPKEEYSSLAHIAHKELHLFADMVGMPGFVGKSLYEKLFPSDDLGRETFLEGSRNMTSSSRRYYEKELGAMAGPNPGGGELEPYGYSEAIRRFIQPEHELKKVNPLRNKMPGWIPGSDALQNLHLGDPYAQIAEGFARLPGEGYAALHPEVMGVNPEDYPVLNKFQILADVAPYSKQFSKFRDIIRGLSKADTETRISYETTMDHVRQVKESGISMKKRRFSEETEIIQGTVKTANEYGLQLNEMPGRRFSYSSVGTGAADLSAISMGENNKLSAAGVALDVDARRKNLQEFVGKTLAPGTQVRLTVAAGVREHATNAQAVVQAGSTHFNRSLIDKGLGLERWDTGGAESRAMYGGVARTFGAAAEGLSFTGDESVLNPMRYVAQPYNSKLWQNRTDISQYEQREMYGTSMRRWQRPLHDFIEPYMRGLTRRVTGKRIVPEEVQFKRDLNTLADTLKYLRGVANGYTNESKRTSVGGNMFSPPDLLTSGLSDHEGAYFRSFLGETNSKKRHRILEDVSPELSRALTTQWVAKDAEVARGDGKKVPTLGEGGRLFTKAGLDEYKKAKSQLDYGDFQRSKETAEFFQRTGFKLPDEKSETFAPEIDYQDLKTKIIQQEGYELHDFNIFDDRASQLWRKPYLDGSARELTSGDNRSTETLRQTIETMMVNGRNKSPKVTAIKNASHGPSANVKVTVDVDRKKELLKDARRNPEKYNDQDAA